MQRESWVGDLEGVFLVLVFSPSRVLRFSGLWGRGVRLCKPSVRFMRSPASALKCCSPGPLGDASDNFPLAVASLCAKYASFDGVMCMKLCSISVK